MRSLPRIRCIKMPSTKTRGRSPIKIVSISDIHLGATRIEHTVVPTNIRKTLFPILDDSVDLLVIAGDFYDGPLDMSGPFSYDAMLLIKEISILADTHGFIVRILQGTFTHDRGQNQFFKLFGDDHIKLVSVLDIETIAELGITIMYKPDNLPYSNAMERMGALLKSYDLTTVDILVNHGYFKHLLPAGIPHIPSNTLDADAIRAYVDGFVLNGHVHTPGVYKNVVNNGSFDRLKHGEEEAKGFYVVTYDSTSHKSTYEFVENINATLFNTIDVSPHEPDLEKCRQHVDKLLDKMDAGDVSTSVTRFIRILADDVVTRQAVVSYVGGKYPNLSVSDLAKNKKAPSLALLEEHVNVDLPTITPDNLVEMVSAHLEEQGTPLAAERIATMLEVGYA